jgi:hypothetical protein
MITIVDQMYASAVEYISTLPIGTTPTLAYVSMYVHDKIPSGSKVTNDDIGEVALLLSQQYTFANYNDWYESLKYSFDTNSRAVGGIVIAGIFALVAGYFLLRKR